MMLYCYWSHNVTIGATTYTTLTRPPSETSTSNIVVRQPPSDRCCESRHRTNLNAIKSSLSGKSLDHIAGGRYHAFIVLLNSVGPIQATACSIV